MPVIVVANPKGGVGKTTLSTNLAGYLASRGRAVMLGDVDRQQSSRTWLGLRPDGLPKISWEADGDIVRPGHDLDTPAGTRQAPRRDLSSPWCSSAPAEHLRLHATHEFINQLLASAQQRTAGGRQARARGGRSRR
jgi:chromosome partitioning protein